MKGGSDGAPSPSPVPALGTRSPAPPCGASLFLVTRPHEGEVGPLHRVPGRPPPGEGFSKQRTGQPLQAPRTGGWSESCVSVEKPRHRPGASSLLRRTANLLTRTSQSESIVIRQYTEEAMPGDPKECREHARRCAELAKVATTPEAREQFLSLQMSWIRLAADLDTPKPSSTRSTRWTPPRRSRPRSSAGRAGICAGLRRGANVQRSVRLSRPSCAI